MSADPFTLSDGYVVNTMPSDREVAVMRPLRDGEAAQ